LAYAPIAAAAACLNGVGPDTAVDVGGALGRGLGRLGFSRRSVALEHLRLAFPEQSEAERGRLLLRHLDHLGRGVAELALLNGRHRAALLDRTRVEGWEHLKAAEARTESGGVIVFTAHLGTWDLGAAAMSAQGVPLSVVHRGFGNPHVEQLMSAVRGEGVEELRMGRSVLGVLRALRAGRKVVLLLDQNAHRDEGVFVPFFGRPACTRSGPALIAMRWGFPVVPAFVRREEDGRSHVIRIAPALELGGLGDDSDEALVANVAHMTRIIEEAIRQAPEQWLWLHRRWRTRPAGDQAGERNG
jgi:KDO2-lipid IV(A) lauroyltransferase